MSEPAAGAVSPARLAAWRALVRLRGAGGHFDDSLEALPELQALEPRDRASPTSSIVGTIKRRGRSTPCSAPSPRRRSRRRRGPVLEALRLAAFQLLFLDRVPAYAVVDDAVRLVSRQGRARQGFRQRRAAQGRGRRARTCSATLSEGDGMRAWAVRHSCPVWMVRLLRRELGDEAAERFLVAANAAPERCLRVNTLRGALPAARAALAAAGAETRGVPGLPQALVYDGPSLQRSAPFRDGLVTPQSRGSQIAGLVAADRRSRTARARAGPLRRSRHQDGPARARCSARRRHHRRRRRRGAARRPARQPASGSAWTASRLSPPTPSSCRRRATAAYDAVLLDAPCSGLGTLGSRADLRWRRRAADIARLADLQRRLLLSAARCVRPGGALTYAVCTLTQAETLRRARAAARRRASWASTTSAPSGRAWRTRTPAAVCSCLPPDGGGSGFFVARFRRIAGA